MQATGDVWFSHMSTQELAALVARPEEEPAPAPAQQTQHLPLVILLGPTASGKTALSISLAQSFNGEIVGADSRQIYRKMDIGTAKPTPAERAVVPHHLIDVIDPDQSFSLAQYQEAAYAAITAIHARGNLSLLVGGTGQYITAVIEGWGIPEVPPHPHIRTELENFAEEFGARALHDRLRQADPAAADRIDYRNVRRVVRALEVYLATGTPISVLQRKEPPPYRLLQIGITLPRDVLYTRIDARIGRMIEQGLEAEVRALLEQGYTWNSPAMTGLGYAQWQPYFERQTGLDDVIAAIRRETRAFVRRQYTWFHGHDLGIHWLDVTQITPGEVIRLVGNWLQGD